MKRIIILSFLIFISAGALQILTAQNSFFDTRQNAGAQAVPQKAGSALPGKISYYLWLKEAWKHSNDEVFTYNLRGQITTKTVISGTTGDSAARDSNIYDEFGNKIAYGFYVRKNGTWEFQTGNRSTISYDPEHPGLAAEHTDEVFREGKWQSDGRSVLSYNGDGHMKTRTSSVLIDGKWIEASRISISYDAAGKIEEALLQFTVQGEWTNDKRLIAVKGFFSERETPHTYTGQTFVNGEWVNDEQQETVFPDEFGSTIVTVRKWQNNAWVGFRRSTDMLDANGKKIMEEREDFQNGEWVLSDRGRHTISYEGDRAIEELVDAWDLGNKVFFKSMRLVYSEYPVIASLDPATAETGTMTLYPNPSHDYTVVEIPETLSGDIVLRLVDFSGRTVVDSKQAASTGSYQLETGGLAAGVYVVESYINGRVYRGRLVHY